MFNLPGLPADSVVSIVVYGFGFVLFVCVMARLIRELVMDAKTRFKTENPVLSLFTPFVVLLCAVSMYFYVLAIAAQLMLSYPEDIPNMAGVWTGPLLALSDQVWHSDETTAMSMSWFGAAFLLHLTAEFIRYILGAPLRRRDSLRFAGALNSFEAMQRTDASKGARSPLKNSK